MKLINSRTQNLSQFSSQLVFQVGDELRHDFIYLFVVERSVFVLQQEADGIAFFAGFQVFSFVDIEEGNVFQQFLFGLVGNLFYFRERHVFVEQQGQVALDSGELGEFAVADLHVAHGFQQFLPVEVGEVDFVFDVEIFQEFAGDDAEGCQTFAAAGVDGECGCEDVVGQVADDEVALVQAEAGEDVFDVGLEFVDGGVFVGVRPGACDLLSGEPEAQVQFFTVGCQGTFGVGLGGVVVVAVAKFEELQVGVLAVGVVGDALESAEQEGLAQDVEVGAEGVEQTDQVVGGIGLEVVVVGGAGQ